VSERPDPRQRPDDPAGTKPKVDAESLLPAVREPLVSPAADAGEPGDAEVVDGDLLPEKVTAGALGGYTPKEAPHSPRFQFIYGALFALGLAGLAAIVALAINGAPEKTISPPWSEWRPSGSDPAGQIAQFVAQHYRHNGGKQLVNVDGQPLKFNDTPLKILLDSGLQYYSVGGTGVLYNMCGVGAKDCRIAEGKPSADRLLLLRRESVELALYTFRYTDADNVVTILPLSFNPKTGKFLKRQNLALLLQRSDLAKQLAQPLNTTLVPKTPSINTVGQSPDSLFVKSLTAARMFKFRLQAAGVEGAYIVLKPTA
jgi:hypothetical protein